MGETRLVSCLFLLLAVAVIYAQRYDLPEGSSCVTPSSQPGVCTRLRDCPSLYNLLVQSRRSGDQSGQRFLQRSTCSFKGSTPILCCRGRESRVSELPTAVPQTNTPAPPDSGPSGPQPLVMEHPNRALLPRSCGTETHDNIVGGVNATLGEHPWLVAIEYITYKGPRIYCGGTLINERYVLTAAHCLKTSQNERLSMVRLGEHNLMTDPDCVDALDSRFCADKVLSVPIERALVHPQFVNDANKHNDIGLLRLSRPVDLDKSRFIRPICLPSAQLRDNFEGTRHIVAGWGNNGETWQSDTKLKVDLPVVSNARCSELYKAIGLNLADTQMCAGGEGGKDSCSGDSGGPLMFKDGFARSEKLWYLTGVVSIGPEKCGLKVGEPGVYTRVRPYVTWILDNLKP